MTQTDLRKPTVRRVAVLTAGPSLADQWSRAVRDGRDRMYSAVVAVNSAATMFPCDWACAIDDDSMLRILAMETQPRIGYISHPRWIEQTEAVGKSFALMPGLGVGCSWSFANAMFYAANRLESQYEPGAVDVYGFDCSDAADCAGRPGNHTEDRWLRELQWVRCAWSRNIRVYGSLPDRIHRWLRFESKTLRSGP